MCGNGMFLFGVSHAPNYPIESVPKAELHINATAMLSYPNAMQISHVDPARASLLVCSPPVPIVGGHAATIDSLYDCNLFTDIAKPASDRVEGPYGPSSISPVSRGSTTTCVGSIPLLVGGSAAAYTSPLALSPLLSRTGQQLPCSLLPPSPLLLVMAVLF